MMLTQLVIPLRKITAVLLVIFGTGCVVATFATRLDQEVCVNLYQYSPTQPSENRQLIFDSTNGRVVPETRSYLAADYLSSPNESGFIYVRSTLRDPDLSDIYLKPDLSNGKAQILQQAVRVQGGSEAADRQIRWSHDSQRIAYLWSDSEKNLSLSVTDANSGQTQTVTPFPNDPTQMSYQQVQEWSADNRYFTVIDQVLNETRYSIWDADTMTAVAYPLEARSLARGTWSPVGHTFAALVKDDTLKPTTLMMINLDQPNAVIQVPLPQLDIQHVMWSPDGKALVIGYLTCGSANCRQQWHYDLFGKDGMPLASDLAGSIFNSSNISGETVDGPDGQTSFSGYDFNAAWSDDGQRFVFIQQPATGDNPTYSIRAFDLKQRQEITLGTYAAVNFSNRFFHTNRMNPNSSRIIEPIPYMPLTNQMLLMYMDKGKISVALTSANFEQPLVLVSGADRLISPPNLLWQGQFWVTNWYRNDQLLLEREDHLLIEWSVGEGKDKQLKLTSADSDGSNLHTFDIESSDLLGPSFINKAHRKWLGFIGQNGDKYSLYLLDLDTGNQTRLLDGLDSNSFWEVAPSPQSDVMLIRGNIHLPDSGRLYLYSEATQTLSNVDVQPRSSAAWSSDGQKIFLMGGDQKAAPDFMVLDQDGRPIAAYPSYLKASQEIAPGGWSKCYFQSPVPA